MPQLTSDYFPGDLNNNYGNLNQQNSSQEPKISTNFNNNSTLI